MSPLDELARLRRVVDDQRRPAAYHEALPVFAALVADLPICVTVTTLAAFLAITAGPSAGACLGRLCLLLAEALVHDAPATAEPLAELAGLLLWSPAVDVETVWRRLAKMPASCLAPDAQALLAAMERRDADVLRLQAQIVRAEAAAMEARRAEGAAEARADRAEAATRQASREALALEQERDVPPPARMVAMAALSESADEATIAAATRAIERDRRRGGVA